MTKEHQVSAAETEVLESVQCGSFEYFMHEVNPGNDLVCDKTAENWPASIAGQAWR